MRVLALGGTGTFGSIAVDFLARDPEVDSIVIGCRDTERGEAVTAVVGLGCSPGVTNLVAKSAGALLDQVESISVIHAGSAEGSLGGVANLMHMFDLIHGLVMRGGELVARPGFSERERYDFGEPLGVVECGLISHPEPVMLRRSFPHLEECEVRLGLVPAVANDLLRVSVAFELTADTPTRIRGLEISPREFLAHHLHQWHVSRASGGHDEVLFGVQVIVGGPKDGESRQLVYRTYEDVSLLIGGALALGASWLGNLLIDSPGVHTADECVEPDRFLRELSAMGPRGLRL